MTLPRLQLLCSSDLLSRSRVGTHAVREAVREGATRMETAPAGRQSFTGAEAARSGLGELVVGHGASAHHVGLHGHDLSHRQRQRGPHSGGRRSCARCNQYPKRKSPTDRSVLRVEHIERA